MSLPCAQGCCTRAAVAPAVPLLPTCEFGLWGKLEQQPDTPKTGKKLIEDED